MVERLARSQARGRRAADARNASSCSAVDATQRRKVTTKPTKQEREPNQMNRTKHIDPAADWKDRGEQGLTKVKFNRAYALDSLGELGLAAALKARHDVIGP